MNERILVVEDDADVVRVVASFLEREGYRVQVALDGALGLDAAFRDPPDLVILDWMLPVVDGPTFLARLRRGLLERAQGPVDGGNHLRDLRGRKGIIGQIGGNHLHGHAQERVPRQV